MKNSLITLRFQFSTFNFQLTMRKLILFTFLISSVFIKAQEVFLNADVVSNYVWRGMKLGNACVQPTLGVNWKGLTFSAWGSTEFKEDNNEIDLILEYEFNRLTLYAINYFEQTEEEPLKYFNYSSHHTGHTFEAGAAYCISEKFPLTVSWYTTFAGNDYRENDKRAWSSYGEISYPFHIKEVEMTAEAGFTPWESMYSDKLNVVNLGLSATKEIKLSPRFSLSVFGKLIVNPYEEQTYFVFGISL